MSWEEASFIIRVKTTGAEHSKVPLLENIVDAITIAKEPDRIVLHTTAGKEVPYSPDGLRILYDTGVLREVHYRGPYKDGHSTTYRRVKPVLNGSLQVFSPRGVLYD